LKAQEELIKILTFDATLECKDALIRCKEELLESKEEELERLASVAEKMTATMDGETVSRTRNLDPLGKAIENKAMKENEVEDLKKEIKQIQKEKEQLKAEHEQRAALYRSIIDNLQRPEFIKVLYGKYFLGKTLRQIAKEINYSYRNVRYLHRDALKAIEKAEKGQKG
jgi:DNA-directed RNA polymerase specialized sigma subunit